MAFNPHAFDTIYGFSLLDELHNFFPELLYDESLFSESFLGLMRYRVKQLFPAAFERQHNMYRIYQSGRRATEAVHWRPGPTVVTATATATAPIEVPPPLQRRVGADPMQDLLNVLMNPMLTHISYSATLDPNGRQDPAAATHEQIAAGSTLVSHADVPADTQCAICMDRDSDTTQEWRRLHCEHYFHTSCIDQWFNRNMLCPVCRADIRSGESH